MIPKGVITAMVTPFDGDQQISERATYQLIDRLLEQGVDGLFILGTNGEFFALLDDEKVAFAQLVTDYVDGRVPVYVGAGACGTKETIELAKRYAALGVAAISVITPYLLPLSQQELLHHYSSLAAAVELPIIMYNMPKLTGVNLEPATVEQLLAFKNIVGIKDSSGNLETVQGYLEAAAGSDFAVLIGSDSKILDGLRLGAAGAVSATSNVITETIVSIYHHFSTGNLAAAQQAQADVDVLRAVLPLGTLPSVLKRALALSGIAVGDPRAPVLPLAEQHNEAVRQALAYYRK